ncbi:uncharacterized protein LOC128218365 [Mya arenaria]|uniref:uncharacterized protein LOC128218365 n=1 Tax=Mya arenaria TaxID=6604 RepID=UPI0022E5E203|nr:uncharacterized protein LOC128218365 [Mya arenaria]
MQNSYILLQFHVRLLILFSCSKLRMCDSIDISEWIYKYRSNIVRFLVSLRDVGKETCYEIQDILDPNRTRDKKRQHLAVALVCSREIENENHSILEEFTKYLHSGVFHIGHDRLVQKDRMAVVMNSTRRFHFTHGECRIFDPQRHFLYEIIDEGHRKAGINESVKRSSKTIYVNDSAKGTLGQMHASLKKTHTAQDGCIHLYVLFSHYVPCDIDFHECSSILDKFVSSDKQNLIIGYEAAFEFTNEKRSLEILDQNENIFIVKPKAIFKEIRSQMETFFHCANQTTYREDEKNKEYFKSNGLISKRNKLFTQPEAKVVSRRKRHTLKRNYFYDTV